MSKPMQTVRVELPDVETLDLNPNDESIDVILDRRQKAIEAEKQCKLVVAHSDLKLGAILDLNGIKTVSWRGEYIVSRRESSKPRRTISPEKLIELGVSPKIIEAASVYGLPGKLGITVRKAERRESDDYDSNSGE